MSLKFKNIVAGKKYKRKTNNKIGEVTEIDKNSFSILFKGEADAELQDKDDAADFEFFNNSSSGSNKISLANAKVLEEQIAEHTEQIVRNELLIVTKTAEKSKLESEIKLLQSQKNLNNKSIENYKKLSNAINTHPVNETTIQLKKNYDNRKKKKKKKRKQKK